MVHVQENQQEFMNTEAALSLHCIFMNCVKLKMLRLLPNRQDSKAGGVEKIRHSIKEHGKRERKYFIV